MFLEPAIRTMSITTIPTYKIAGLQVLNLMNQAAIITGVLFGLLHIANPHVDIPGMVFTAIGGVLLAWLVIRTGSLWIAWGYHAGWNITSALLFGLKVSGMEYPSTILQTQINGADWLTGGDYGFEASIIIGCIEIIVLSVTVVLANRLPGHPNLIRYFRGNGI